ncbi:MAG TPA: phosphonate metabolism protein/1,5-bisphosphokinase (PRPP-forming) PhnN [Rhodospirillales bacterium]|nr:phosphonate metabolism protein/1,5-bisphosphokinase (PRPP-forming) PhnN [Rhodospirillales bacterium]
MAPRLYYIMGASGAGKDSLLQYARENLKKGSSILFAHRYITRPADAGGENHIALSQEEFLLREKTDCFAMTWESHGFKYGIGIEIDDWLARGADVVVSGSRGHFQEAAARYDAIYPVLVTVSPEILKSRLEARGRETVAQIENRLIRGEAFESISHPQLARIRNDGAIEKAGRVFIDLLAGSEISSCA